MTKSQERASAKTRRNDWRQAQSGGKQNAEHKQKKNDAHNNDVRRFAQIRHRAPELQ